MTTVLAFRCDALRSKVSIPSCVARLFARTYPEHATFFRFRERASERRAA